MNANTLVGKRFGSYIVKEYIGRRVKKYDRFFGNGKKKKQLTIKDDMYRVQCDCGLEYVRSRYNIQKAAGTKCPHKKKR